MLRLFCNKKPEHLPIVVYLKGMNGYVEQDFYLTGFSQASPEVNFCHLSDREVSKPLCSRFATACTADCFEVGEKFLW